AAIGRQAVPVSAPKKRRRTTHGKPDNSQEGFRQLRSLGNNDREAVRAWYAAWIPREPRLLNALVRLDNMRTVLNKVYPNLGRTCTSLSLWHCPFCARNYRMQAPASANDISRHLVRCGTLRSQNINEARRRQLADFIRAQLRLSDPNSAVEFRFQGWPPLKLMNETYIEHNDIPEVVQALDSVRKTSSRDAQAQLPNPAPQVQPPSLPMPQTMPMQTQMSNEYMQYLQQQMYYQQQQAQQQAQQAQQHAQQQAQQAQQQTQVPPNQQQQQPQQQQPSQQQQAPSQSQAGASSASSEHPSGNGSTEAESAATGEQRMDDGPGAPGSVPSE
ncbi:MAG: hypothetical protein MHM6MM_008093, partial [Cercozoa sp. M6MM]